MRSRPAAPILPSVLIVDADEGTRLLYRTILEPLAEVVSESADGVAALALAFRTPPSLLVADARLPRVDGSALCECLRAHHRTAATLKLIVASDEWVARRAESSGADTVLIKPFRPDTLAAAALQLWSARDRVGSANNSIRPRSVGSSGGSNSIRTTAPQV